MPSFRREIVRSAGATLLPMSPMPPSVDLPAPLAGRLPAAALESPACPGCAPGQPEDAPNVPPRRILVEGGGFAPFAVCRCSACGLAYLSPRLTEEAMRAVYEQDDYFEAASGATGASVGYGHYAAQAQALRLTFRRFLKALQADGLTGGDLLEVGCGPGLLLDEARPHFVRREGCEFSPAAARTARTVADAVHTGGAEAIPAGARYDCIIATQVVEHVYDPRAFVQALVSHLRPGGVLVLATPDHGSLWRRAMGRRWPSYKLPEHVLYFDAVTLRRLMRECGVGHLRTVPYPHAFPLSLVASKLGIRWTGRGADRSLWIPGTTLALAGRCGDHND